MGIKDITGQRFGRLIVIRQTDKRKSRCVVWECKCDCGNVVEVKSTNLQNGSTRSCGCLHRDLRIQIGKNRLKDLTGQRFGRLVAIRLLDERKNGKTVWECQCDCGNMTQVGISQLREGGTKSCGCLRNETIAQIGRDSIKDLTGQRFGKLVAIRLLDERKNGKTMWECQCDCGNVIQIGSSHLRSGSWGTRSCGCFLREQAAERAKNTDFDKLLGRIENTSVSAIKSKTVRKDSGTGHRGVSYDNKRHKYYAYIGFKRKRYRLGYFTELEDAIKARKRGEEEVFGPFLKWYEENYPNDK